jgi:hypothetical protein
LLVAALYRAHQAEPGGADLDGGIPRRVLS